MVYRRTGLAFVGNVFSVEGDYSIRLMNDPIPDVSREEAFRCAFLEVRVVFGDLLPCAL